MHTPQGCSKKWLQSHLSEWPDVLLRAAPGSSNEAANTATSQSGFAMAVGTKLVWKAAACGLNKPHVVNFLSGKSGQHLGGHTCDSMSSGADSLRITPAWQCLMVALPCLKSVGWPRVCKTLQGNHSLLRCLSGAAGGAGGGRAVSETFCQTHPFTRLWHIPFVRNVIPSCPRENWNF